MIAKVKKVCFKSTQLSRIGPYPVAATNLSLADFSRLTVTDKHCFKKDHKMFGQGPNSIIMYIFFFKTDSQMVKTEIHSTKSIFHPQKNKFNDWNHL